MVSQGDMEIQVNISFFFLFSKKKMRKEKEKDVEIRKYMKIYVFNLINNFTLLVFHIQEALSIK